MPVVDLRQSSARPPAGVEPCLSEQRPLSATTQTDYLPHPRAARRASTDLGEVGGAQRAERASTDGCQRLTPMCSEGAAAEREGFSAVLAGCAGCAPRNLEFTRGASNGGEASCICGEKRLAANPPSVQLGGVTLTRLAPVVRIPRPLRRRARSAVEVVYFAEREGFEPCERRWQYL